MRSGFMMNSGDGSYQGGGGRSFGTHSQSTDQQHGGFGGYGGFSSGNINQPQQQASYYYGGSVGGFDMSSFGFGGFTEPNSILASGFGGYQPPNATDGSFSGLRGGGRGTKRVLFKTKRHLEESHSPLPYAIQTRLNSLTDFSEVTAIVTTGEVAKAANSPKGVMVMSFGTEVCLWPWPEGRGSTEVLTLELPHSDAPYDAQLMSFLVSNQQQHQRHSSVGGNEQDMPEFPLSVEDIGFLVVTAEGTIRYWPSVFTSPDRYYPPPGTSDDAVRVISQESLTNGRFIAKMAKNENSPMFIVSTNDSQLYSITVVGGEEVIAIRQLQKPGGMFAGLGRILRWGAGRSASTSSPIRALAIQSDPTSPHDCAVLAMTEQELQQWNVSQHRSDLIAIHPLHGVISRTLVDAVASNNQVLTILLDLQPGRERDTIYVLVGSLVEAVGERGEGENDSGAFAADHPPIVSYSVFGFQLGATSGANVAGAGAPTLVEKSFFILPDEPLYDITRHPLLLDNAKLLVSKSDPSACIVWKNAYVLTKVPYDDRTLDKTEGSREFFIGWGQSADKTLVVSSRRGILSVSQPGLSADENLILSSEPPAAIRNGNDDTSRVALLFWKYLTREETRMHLIQELASIHDLDGAVQTVSHQIINSLFERSGGGNVNSNVPRQVAKETNEKRKKHRLFIEFLSNFKHSLSSLAYATLLANEEKVEVARALQNHYKSLKPSQQQGITTEVVPRAVKAWLNSKDSSNIGSMMKQCLEAVESAEGYLSSAPTTPSRNPSFLPSSSSSSSLSSPSTSLVSILLYSNQVFNICFSVTLNYFEDNQIPQFANVKGEEFLPWTLSFHSDILREAHITFTTIEKVSPLPEREQLKQQLIELAENILASFKYALRVIENDPLKFREVAEEHVRIRDRVIKWIFVHSPERAMTLAENSEHFEFLIEVCDKNNETQRLLQYLRRFSENDFVGVLFHWYVSHGKFSKLFELPPEWNGALEEFLKAHPTCSWIHHLKLGNFSASAYTLQNLGVNEPSVEQRKLFLSLSTLSFLAGEETAHAISRQKEVNDQHLWMIRCQELEARNLVTDEALSPAELIAITVRNKADPRRFNKALAILANSTSILRPDEFTRQQEFVWVSAIEDSIEQFNNLSMTDDERLQDIQEYDDDLMDFLKESAVLQLISSLSDMDLANKKVIAPSGQRFSAMIARVPDQRIRDWLWDRFREDVSPYA